MKFQYYSNTINDEKRLSHQPTRLPATKISFLIALVIIALVCLVSSCSEPEVEIVEPPKPQPLTLPESIHVFDIFFTDVQTGWLAVDIMGHGNKYKGGLFKTTDGGVNWFADILSENAAFTTVYFIDKIHGFSIANSGLLFSTSDGGITWAEYDKSKFLGSEHSKYGFSRIYFLNSSEGWMTGSKAGSPIDCGGYGYLFHTTNGGNDWTIQYATTSASLNDVWMLHDGNGWIVGGGSFIDCSPFILHTTDFGNTWVRQNADPNVGGLLDHITFRDPFYGFAYGYMGILRTTNGGVKWDTTQAGLFSAYKLVFMDDTTVFSLRRRPSTIYKSIDKGKNWIIELRLPALFSTMFFLNDSIGWAVGTVTYPSRLALYRYNSSVWTKIR